MVIVEKPMIFTSEGNMLLDDLEPLDVVWEQTKTYTKIRLIHRLNGEIVREEAHVLAHEPLALKTTTGAMN